MENSPYEQQTEVSLKEHRSRVWNIVINSRNDRAFSASADGSYIEWHLSNYTRVACLLETTMFKQLVYHPDESQILTTGTDKILPIGMLYESNEMRSIDGSYDGEIKSIVICKSGEYFVTAGEDNQITI